MASLDLTAQLGSVALRSPLIAASGTVGSVAEWASVADVSHYGAAVAKSVSAQPWPGRPAPRLAPAFPGMLNGIGIQNPGIEQWAEDHAGEIGGLGVPVWGSAVGESAAEFGLVAKGLEQAGVAAIEVNLSCPNLDNGRIFALDADRSAEVVSEVASSVGLPVGAKLSPNSEDIARIGAACIEAGADFLTLTNTATGFGVDIETGRPKLSAGTGGYSGPGLKAISLRCVYEVAIAIPRAPIVGCGGVTTGDDVIEYLMAGASAVGLGTVHLAEPKSGRRIAREMAAGLKRLGYRSAHAAYRRAL
ncbi:MAG: dihydroorotate dehydrogenase [Acidimicrobiia bacterium]|nr:dihydroorotate dehydrogenase [Acidimicrobiia bacterium]